jgi:Domain of unknown function (DUF4442)
MNNNFSAFQLVMLNKFKYNFFLLTKLPMAFLAGLKIASLSSENAVVSVRFKWLNQNPFKSIYFAVLSMAAELSTGILAFGHIYKTSPVSMLVVKVEGEFYKKAVGTIKFTCNNGNDIKMAIEQTLQTGEGKTIIAESIGVNSSGEMVAKFLFTWSFKAKK